MSEVGGLLVFGGGHGHFRCQRGWGCRTASALRCPPSGGRAGCAATGSAVWIHWPWEAPTHPTRSAAAATPRPQLQQTQALGLLERRLPQRSPSPPPVTGFDLFQERTNQLLFWFDGWSPHQRQLFLGALLAPRNLRQGELDFLQHKLVDVRSPIPVYDFLALLPHHVALRIFSMLDPRSLSRAAQVRQQHPLLMSPPFKLGLGLPPLHLSSSPAPVIRNLHPGQPHVEHYGIKRPDLAAQGPAHGLAAAILAVAV